MIHLFGPEGNSVEVFRDLDEVCKHINGVESEKLLDSCSSVDDIWNFSHFTYKRLSFIGHKTLEQSFSKIGREAFEQELDLIEITKGNYESPIQIPVTPEVDIHSLKEKWCQEYCEAHGYTLVDAGSGVSAFHPPLPVVAAIKENSIAGNPPLVA